MKKTAVVTSMIVFGVALLFVSAALAHLPEGQTYFAFQFPDALIPTFDGNLSDWDIVGDAFTIRTEDMWDTQGGKGKAGTGVDLADFATSIKVGWNASDNKLYLAIQNYDDMHIVMEAGGYERLEVITDADHSGGQFKGWSKETLGEEQWNLQEGGQAQQFGFAYPPAWIHNWGGGPDEAQWVLQPPYTQSGFDFEGIQPDGAGTTTYELALTLWDNVNYHGADQSQMHILQEEETIGLSVVMNDPDQKENMWENFWQTSPQGGTFQNGSVLADVLLSPVTVTAVEPSSWGRIKASFTQ